MQNQMKNKDAFILISVPVELLEEADICAGDALQMYVDDGCIVIEPLDKAEELICSEDCENCPLAGDSMESEVY